MAKYSYITDKTNNNRKIQVESAVRDGEGKNIVNNYAKQNGYYENMGVGQADNLSTDRQIDNPETACPPITMGITGGEAEIKSGIETFEYMEGASEVFNQLYKTTKATFTALGLTFTNNNDGSWTISGSTNFDSDTSDVILDNQETQFIAGHKYLYGARKTTGVQSYIMRLGNWVGATNEYAISTCTSNDKNVFFNIRIYKNSTFNNFKLYPQIIDLTLIYGAGNEPTTVAEFKSRFPLDYYAYNAGSILSAKTNALISRGRQQWDEEWENGSLDGNGANQTNASYIRSKNYIPCIGGQQYYFRCPSNTYFVLHFYDINKNHISAYAIDNNKLAIPSNASYMRFYMGNNAYGTTYNHDITISVYFEDGEGYSEYYPYSQDSVALPNIELRAIGDLKDIAYASGGGKRKLGYVDLGTLTYGKGGANDDLFTTENLGGLIKAGAWSSGVVKAICPIYIADIGSNVYNKTKNMTFGTDGNGKIYIYDSGRSSLTTAQFKTAMSGVYLLYELATETDLTENTGWDNTINVDNYGTLEFTTDPQQVPQVPQPYFIKYTVNLGEWVDSAYVRTNGDGTDIALKSEMDALEQELVDGDIVVAKSKLSDNLDTNVVQNDVDAYTFRTSGGSLEIGETCKVKEIVGGTVAFNQIANIPSSGVATSNGVTYTYSSNSVITANGTSTGVSYQNIGGTMTGLQGHKIFICGCPSGGANDTYYLHDGYISNQNDTGNGVIIEAGANSIVQIIISEGVQANNLVFRPQFFDLTAMFGSTIADYIYSLEQANAGAGVAWFKRYFPNTYYAYNTGTLVNVKTSGKKYVGFNQWDEQWENGTWGGSGEKQGNSASIRNKNPIRVLPNVDYYIKAPEDLYFWAYDADMNYLGRIPSSNGYHNRVVNFNDSRVAYVNIGMWDPSYENNICLNFHYDGERDGEYEPYESNEYPLSPVELRGIAKKDAQGNLYFDGDTYEPDGKVTRRYRVVDLGTLNWSYYGVYGGHNLFFSDSLVLGDNRIARGDDYKIYGICSKYIAYINLYNGDTGQGNTLPNKAFRVRNVDGRLYFNDDDFTNANDFKNANSGVYLVYELATPTEETTDTYQETQQVDNWGTEQYLPPETDTRPCEIPVGHSTDYLLDIRSKVEIMPDSPTNDGVYVVETSSGVNTYIPLGTWLSNNGYVNQISANAIKENIGGALRHQLVAQVTAGGGTLDFNNTAWVDLGSLTWAYRSDNAVFTAYVGMPDRSTVVCPSYKSANNLAANMPNKTCSTTPSYSSNNIMIKDTAYTDATAFKNAMKGILLAYEKA